MNARPEAHRPLPPVRQERERGARSRCVPETDGVGRPEALPLPPARCHRRLRREAPKPGRGERLREAGLTQVPPAGRAEGARGIRRRLAARAAEMRRGRRKYRERRPRRQRRASPAGRAEALTHLRRGDPPAVQQRQEQRQEQRRRLRGAGKALRPRRRAEDAGAAQAHCACSSGTTETMVVEPGGPGGAILDVVFYVEKSPGRS